MDTSSNQKYPTKAAFGTFLYTLLLASLVAMVYVFHKDPNILFGVSGFPNFDPSIPIAVCLALISPFLITATVYEENRLVIVKSFLASSVILMFVLSVAYYSPHQNETMGIGGLAFIFMLMIETLVGVAVLLVVVGFGFLLKLLSTTQSKVIRRIFFATPYLIVIAAFSLVVFNAKTAGVVACEKMTYGKQSACYFAVAKKTGNLDSCMKVSNSNYYQDPSTLKFGTQTAHCIEAAISRMKETNTLNAQSCGTFLTEDARSICYNRVAVKLHDPALCEKVKGTYDKNIYILLPAVKSFILNDPKLDKASCYLDIKAGIPN